MPLPDSWLYAPAQRIMMSAAFEIEVLTLETQARAVSRAVALAAPAQPGDVDPQPWLDDSHELTERVAKVLRWHIERLAAVNADLGVAEHNRIFRPWFREVRQTYLDEMRGIAADAWGNRGAYLPNLTQTLWGARDRRNGILASLFAVFNSLPPGSANHAFSLAGAMQEMYGANVRNANWLSSRMFELTPRQRARDRKGLIPPGSRGVSYEHLRVVRTEMAGLQQEMAYERYDRQPWVTGYNWRLSPQHPESDICDSLQAGSPYTNQDRPRIPHPNCLCFVTPAEMRTQDFNSRVRGWLDGENDFLDNYSGWVAPEDPNFLQSGPLRATGALEAWSRKGAPPDSPQGVKARWARAGHRRAGEVALNPGAFQMLDDAKRWAGAKAPKPVTARPQPPPVVPRFQVEDDFLGGAEYARLSDDWALGGAPRGAIAERNLPERIQRYTDAGYNEVNGELRRRARMSPAPTLSGETRATIEEMRSHAVDVPPGTVVFRGRDDLVDLGVGGTYKDPGFMSSSASPQVAGGFASSTPGTLEDLGTMFELRFTGRHKAVIINSAELEYILPPGTTLRVAARFDNVELAPNVGTKRYYVVELE